MIRACDGVLNFSRIVDPACGRGQFSWMRALLAAITLWFATIFLAPLAVLASLLGFHDERGGRGLADNSQAGTNQLAFWYA